MHGNLFDPKKGAVRRRCADLCRLPVLQRGPARLQPRALLDQPDLEHARRASGLHVRLRRTTSRWGRSWPPIRTRQGGFRSSPGLGRAAVPVEPQIFSDIRQEAAQMQRREIDFVSMLRHVKSPRRHPHLDPGGIRRGTDGESAGHPRRDGGRHRPAPDRGARMADLTGFSGFLQSLKESGHEPDDRGGFPAGGDRSPPALPTATAPIW